MEPAMINWPEMLHHGRLGRRLLGRSWGRFVNGDRRGRDGAAHSRHLKPGSARLLAEGVVSVWRFGSGSGDGVRMPAVALPPLGPAHHHIDPPAAAARTDQLLAPIEDGRFGAVPGSHLGGVGLDLMPTVLAPHDLPDLDRGGSALEQRQNSRPLPATR
jgi:hypothetical protein